MKKINIIIGLIIVIICVTLLIRYNTTPLEAQNNYTTRIICNDIKMAKKTTKKADKKKTTKKKKTNKKKTKKSLPKMNVKATRQQMIDYAYSRVVATWGANQWDSFYQIVSHESGWNPNSVNKSSGACGLFQFVPCSKGGSAYKTNYKVQIDKGILYITYRYGTPKKAWSFWQKHHWY